MADSSQQQQQQQAEVDAAAEQMQGLSVHTATPHTRTGPRQYPQPAFLTPSSPSSSLAPAAAVPQQSPQQWKPLSTFPASPLPPAPPSTLPQTSAAPQQQPQQSPTKPRQRIDPNSMPNPTATSTGESATAADAAAAPQATHPLQPPPPCNRPQTRFADTGNASARFVRLTSYALPASRDLAASVAAPLAAHVTPLADAPDDERPPLVDAGEDGPLRCGRCRAYVSPFAGFVRGGKAYHCRFCGMANDVPDAYFSPLRPDGQRADIDARPELTHGSVEYSVANCRMYASQTAAAAGCAVCAVIDVSDQAVASGAVALVAGCLRSLLVGDAAVARDCRIGVVTYNTAVHFWDISHCPPRMLVIPDVDGVFVPAASGLFVPNSVPEAKAGLEHLLTNLQALAQQQHPTQRLGPPAFGAAVQAAQVAMKAAKLAGKALVFHASLPTGGPGALKERDDTRVSGTDKERPLLQPQSAFFKTLAKQCATADVGVDVFLLSSREYADVASIGEVCRLTGGQLYHFPRFDVARDSWRMESELRRNMTRECGYDASLRVRLSSGLSVGEYIGHYADPDNSDVLDIDIPTIDADKTISVTLQYDERLNESRPALIQAAMLYTTMAGERRVRVHTLAVPVSSQYPAVFRALDNDAIVVQTARSIVQLIRKGNAIPSVAASTGEQIVETLAAYRRYCTTAPSAGQLILPESIRLLPLYYLCMNKLPLLRTEVRSDLRSAAMLGVLSETVPATILRFYPRLFALHDLVEQQQQQQQEGQAMPQPVRLSVDFLSPHGVYLLDDGTVGLHVWVGSGARPETLLALFGTADAASMAPAALSQAFASTLQSGDPAIAQVTALIGAIAQQRMHSFLSISASSQSSDTPGSLVLYKLQLEDKQQGTMSYVDFLCHLHRQISLKLA